MLDITFKCSTQDGDTLKVSSVGFSEIEIEVNNEHSDSLMYLSERDAVEMALNILKELRPGHTFTF